MNIDYAKSYLVKMKRDLKYCSKISVGTFESDFDRYSRVIATLKDIIKKGV